MAPSSPYSSLLPPLATIATLLLVLVLNNHVVLSSASAASTIQCRSGWTNTIQQIPPSKINDGYCDCPLDGGIDEPNTGACSGSVDGMWTGIPAKYESSDYDAAQPATYFACPQQPSLKLPISRVNDGICDCCDGADESTSPTAGGTTTSCPDICDEVLAEERAALSKLRADYEVGSRTRLESISQYEAWSAETNAQLQNIRGVELESAMREQSDAEEALKIAKVNLANEWLQGVKKGQDVVDQDIVDIVTGGKVDVAAQDVASFIVSLCQLSAEAKSGNVANERCLALDRASLDLGLLWNHNGSEDDALPTFVHLDANVESALVDYADKIMRRLEGKDTAKDGTASKSKSNAADRDRQQKDRRHDYSSGDDPYGDDWEDDHHDDYHYDDEEDEYHHESDVENESHEGEGGEAAEGETKELSPNELLVKSLLDNISIDRTLFKDQSNRLLQFSLEGEENNDGDEQEESDEEASPEGVDDNEEATPSSGGVDPMALQMVKSNLSKSLSNILRGEKCAKSAARYVASLMESESDLLQPLAILMLYHSKVSSEDVAELVYSFSGEGEASKEECSASSMCPPGVTQIGERNYPPSFVVQAAQKRCEQRDNSPDVCGAQAEEEGEIEFPSSIPDGYYNYFAVKSRDDEDALVSYFDGVNSLHQNANMIGNMVLLRKQKNSADRTKSSLTSRASALEKQLGGDGSSGTKYGPDGELYSLRDTCHSVESGKYEYEVCIFGKASQRDIGQKSGGTNLGSWEGISMSDDDDEQRLLKWGGGTKCWNGPVRSAEVIVTCGSETKLLTADEPQTCQYVFTMESPIGCDEQFKLKNSL